MISVISGNPLLTTQYTLQKGNDSFQTANGDGGRPDDNNGGGGVIQMMGMPSINGFGDDRQRVHINNYNNNDDGSGGAGGRVR